MQDFWPDNLVKSVSAALAILTSMITPALLISACGTFILSTSNRLGRVLDRVRALSDKLEDLVVRNPDIQLLEERRTMLYEQMDKQSARAALLARSLTIFYMAAAIFVATSVAIGVISVFFPKQAWLPVVLGIIGACFMFFGSIVLILEARMALRTLRSEMDFLSKLVNYHSSKIQKQIQG